MASLSAAFGVILSVFLVFLTLSTYALPLSTNSRWIVDDSTGDRVKLACVNWVSHLEVLVAEGLSKQPVDVISKKIISMGFNCVRLTWPLFLVTNETLGNTTVRQSFTSLGLNESIAGLQANNPAILDIPFCNRYMQQGSEAVHSANPKLLVIVSGLDYGKDLSFLRNTPFNITFSNKLVYEIHWYAFSDGSTWATQNPNDVCGRVVSNTMKRSGFLLDKGYPLFVSEHGIDLRGTNVNDNRYLGCFMGFAAELDLDFALWTLVGSYYLREGIVGLEEFYGVLSWNWCQIRNKTFSDIISSIQTPFQGPGLSEVLQYKLIYHPSTGECLIRTRASLRLGPCGDSDFWSYTPQGNLLIKGTHFCITADKIGQPVKLSPICSNLRSKWNQISQSKMHLAANLDNGDHVCLDVGTKNMIVTSSCNCLSNDSSCDPSSQWFKLVNSTRGHGVLESRASPIMALDSS